MIFVIIDLIKYAPITNVMKVAWILVVLYTGPIGLFIYLMACREPVSGAHEKFIQPVWKQSLGSEVHCLAGDATGIILAALILSFLSLLPALEIFIEYLAGFCFGLFIFQALFMKKMMGGDYSHAVKTTILPEWLSMNMIMAGMIPVMVIWTKRDPVSINPLTIHFWGKMSLASIIGGLAAYPMNHWLVAKDLKHGMMTIRKKLDLTQHASHEKMDERMHNMNHGQHSMKKKVSKKEIVTKIWISVGSLVLGIVIAALGHHYL